MDARLKFFLAPLCLLLLCLGFFSCRDGGTEVALTDDWKVSTPSAQGLDSTILNDLNVRIANGAYGEIHSLLIVRHGYLVAEKYYRGYNSETLHEMYSVSKSVTSALIGIAIDQGKISSTSLKLLSFFPEYSSIANLDSNKQSITLDDVLTMRAGFDWNESIAPYGDPRNPTSLLASSSDWVKYMLDLPMIAAPGTRFRYNSGCTVLLSGVLLNTTGMQAEAFASRNLFASLGIARWQWNTGARGLTNTGWGLNLRPRDMAKFGLLYLKNGVWDGKQIISQNWIAKSTSALVTVIAPYSYGYQWWMMPIDSLAGQTPKPDDIKIAWGYGDQFIFVIPALDMVVISTAGNYGATDDQAIIFLQKDIIRAVRD